MAEMSESPFTDMPSLSVIMCSLMTGNGLRPRHVRRDDNHHLRFSLLGISLNGPPEYQARNIG